MIDDKVTELGKELNPIPVIENFFASRDTIEFGGDTTTLTIEASGGELQYLWDVDLGDLLPISDGHKALFSGSECCVGLKDIKCTVSNDKGEVEAIVNSGTKLDKVAALTLVAARLPICNNSKTSLSEPNCASGKTFI